MILWWEVIDHTPAHFCVFNGRIFDVVIETRLAFQNYTIGRDYTSHLRVTVSWINIHKARKVALKGQKITKKNFKWWELTHTRTIGLPSYIRVKSCKVTMVEFIEGMLSWVHGSNQEFTLYNCIHSRCSFMSPDAWRTYSFM